MASIHRTSGIPFICVVFLFGFFYIQSLRAQEIDILLKGGHVIDPKNKIDAKLDVAISNGKISQVGPDLPVRGAKKVIDVTGLFVTPGLIDMHVHVFQVMNRVLILLTDRLVYHPMDLRSAPALLR